MDKTEENNIPQTPTINVVENNLPESTDVKNDDTIDPTKQDVVVSGQNLTEEVKTSEIKEEDKVADNTTKEEVQDTEQAPCSCNCDVKVEDNVIFQEMVNLNVADNASTVLTGDEAPVTE